MWARAGTDFVIMPTSRAKADVTCSEARLKLVLVDDSVRVRFGEVESRRRSRAIALSCRIVPAASVGNTRRPDIGIERRCPRSTALRTKSETSTRGFSTAARHTRPRLP